MCLNYGGAPRSGPEVRLRHQRRRDYRVRLHHRRRAHGHRVPEPDELWRCLRAAEGIDDDGVAEKLLTPTLSDRARPLRYYQEIAVNRTTQAVLQGRRRILLTLCTGSGKTAVAFQECWKLWNARWTRKAKPRTPRYCFRADRNVLVDYPMAKDFSPFGDARAKISGPVAKRHILRHLSGGGGIGRRSNGCVLPKLPPRGPEREKYTLWDETLANFGLRPILWARSR